MQPIAALIRNLYALRQAGTITDAEARWVLAIVLPVYGLSLNQLSTLLEQERERSAQASQQNGASANGTALSLFG